MHQLKNSPITLLTMLALGANIFFSAATVTISQTGAASAKDRLDGAIKLIRASQYSEAEKILKTTVTDTETDAESWYYLGVIYLQRKDFKKAAGAFETSIKIRPGLAESHNGLAYALLRRGKLVEAQAEAEKALTINPKSVDANYTMGVIHPR